MAVTDKDDPIEVLRSIIQLEADGYTPAEINRRLSLASPHGMTFFKERYNPKYRELVASYGEEIEEEAKLKKAQLAFATRKAKLEGIELLRKIINGDTEYSPTNRVKPMHEKDMTPGIRIKAVEVMLKTSTAGRQEIPDRVAPPAFGDVTNPDARLELVKEETG